MTLQELQELLQLEFGSFNDINNFNRIKEAILDTKASAVWSIPGIAFVDPDATGPGTLGNGNDPFSTVALAEASNPEAIFLLPGNYGETINIVSGRTYFSYPGVTFTSGGVRALVAQNGTKWLGYASFIANTQMVYLNQNVDLVDFEFEFDEIIETGTNARGLTLHGGTTNLSNIKITGNKFVGLGGNAYGIYLRNRLGGNINIREIYGDYAPINAFQHSNATLILNFDKAVVRDGGAGGNLADYSQTFISHGSDANSTIILNGDIYSEVTTLLGSNTAAVTTWSSALGKIIINGDIYALNNRGIYSTGGTVEHNGKIKTLNLACQCAGGVIIAKNSVINQAVSSIVSGTGKLELLDSSVKSTTSDQIIDVIGNTAELRISNSILEGTSGLCVEHNAGTSTIAFQGNVSSNLANSALTDACSPTGFVQQTGLVAPTIS